MSTILMQCPRDFVLRSTQGHTVIFKAGKPTPVPEALYAEALARNIVPVKGPIDTDEAANGKAVALTGPLRDALIYHALDAIVKRNQVEDFDGGGNPKPDAVKEMVGVAISATERTKHWANYRELMGNNIELPTHPNLDLVIELQSLSTRKDLEAFAEEHNIAIGKNSGKNNRELKAQLIGSMVNFQQAPIAAPSTGTLEQD